jgi:hypothetical protein
MAKVNDVERGRKTRADVPGMNGGNDLQTEADVVLSMNFV